MQKLPIRHPTASNFCCAAALLLPLVIGIALTQPAYSQEEEPPRAIPVDPTLANDPANDSFQHGRNLYESAKRSSGEMQMNLFYRCIDVFQNYLRQYPRSAHADAAWWYLGQSHYNIGEVNEAKRCFHSLLQNHGKGRYAAAAAYTLAAEQFNNKEYISAAKLFEHLAAVADKPDDRARGSYYAGKSMELAGQSDKAIAYYQKVISSSDPANPYLPKAQFYLAKILLDKKQPEQALTLMDAVVRSPAPPEIRSDAALNAAAAAIQMGNHEQAEAYFETILKSRSMEKFHPQAQVALMAVRLEQKRYDEVIRIFRSSTYSSEDAEVESSRLMIAARAYMMLKRDADALPLFREVERLEKPGTKRAFDASYYRLVLAYRIKGNHVIDQVDSFLSIYGESHAKDPKIHTAHLIRAETLYSQGKNIEAANAYREIDPGMLTETNRRGFLYKRGRCLADVHDYEAAVKSLNEFLEKYPDDPRAALARTVLAQSLAEINSTAAAVKEFDLILESSKDPKLRLMAALESADLLRAQNQLEEANKRYRTLLESNLTSDTPTIAKVSYWLGWGLVKTDHPEESIPYLEKARELAPDSYRTNCGILLALVHQARRDQEKLIPEVTRAIESGYAGELPEPLIRWAANQAYNSKDYTNAARFYDLITDDENPELVAKEVWRFHGKARLHAGDARGALRAINHTLKAEDDPAWQADALADKAAAHLALKEYKEAEEALQKGLKLRSEGRIGAELNLIRGDLALAQNDVKEAIRSYILPVRLMDDEDRVVRPRALQKLIDALKKDGQQESANKYQQEFLQKYPNWKP